MAGPFMLRLRVALFAALAVALVATGWAHRAPDVNVKVLAFLVANGATADDFCGGAGVDPEVECDSAVTITEVPSGVVVVVAGQTAAPGPRRIRGPSAS